MVSRSRLGFGVGSRLGFSGQHDESPIVDLGVGRLRVDDLDVRSDGDRRQEPVGRLDVLE
ncbi:hypothetical protein [Natrialba sp. INN-245]|uniref:hypothetical protein n=1 Tax=Natrialba sp. INN-245 TaxID=2690967 RepID=UPI00130FE208|nr:hypothetical protein [Natrialba sp. INN-245]MWV40375.1 hypothetical protein [Natrialba sp. INN-245]